MTAPRPDMVKVRRETSFRAGVATLLDNGPLTNAVGEAVQQATTVSALQLYHSVTAAMEARGARPTQRTVYDGIIRAALEQLGIEVRA